MARKIPLPRITQDPDARLVRWGWIVWAALIGFLALRWILFRPWDAWGYLHTVPILALCLLWVLWRGGGRLWHWARGASLAAWNGSYFEFDGRQIRVLFDDGDIYLVADDVFAALDLARGDAAVERARVAAGRDGIRAPPQARELAFTERGLAAWLERRQAEQAVRFQRWFEREVAAPYRKRRER